MPTLKIRPDLNKTHELADQFQLANADFIDRVTDFIASDSCRDEAKLVIASKKHLDEIQTSLQEKMKGCPGNTLFEHAKCTFIEAETIIEWINIDGWPNEAKFNEVIARILAQMRQEGDEQIHILGETVALLSAEGKADAALFLEILWERLAAIHALSFPCAVPLSLSLGVSGKATDAVLDAFFHKCQIQESDISLVPANSSQLIEMLQQVSNELGAEIILRRKLAEILIKRDGLLARKTAALQHANEKLTEEANRCREIEKELAYLQKVQEITQEISHLGSWVIDLKTLSFKCSDEFYRICGLEPQSRIIDVAFAQSIIHPEDQEASQKAIQASIEKNAPYIIEKRIIRPDGSIRHVLSQGQALYNAAQEVETVIGSYLDITDLKLAEESLRQSHEELQKLSAHQEMVKEKEQKRIAQELHDELGGLLTGIKAYITTAIESLKSDARKANNLLSEAANIADTALDSTRRIVNDLHPSVLDHLGLWEALKWYGERITQGTNLTCSFSIDESVHTTSMSMEQSTMLFRLCQEALTNVIRHSKASHMTISASCHLDLLSIRIEDDGIGFNAGVSANPGSMGISGMYERARYLGGEIVISSTLGKGTAVQLTLPLKQVQHAA